MGSVGKTVPFIYKVRFDLWNKEGFIEVRVSLVADCHGHMVTLNIMGILVSGDSILNIHNPTGKTWP